MSHQQFTKFKSQLSSFLLPEEIIEAYTQRYAFGTDASFYRLIPKLVLKLKNKNQVKQVLSLANQYKVPVTFRAAGTSLSGQAITDSVLITLSRDWQNYDITHLGEKITLQPGIIGAKANQLLHPFNKKLGPDPASIDSCKIGGIAANNSSGMCCGVKQNSYHTLADMTIIFADGTELDTSNQHSCNHFLNNQPQLINQISQLLLSVQNNPEIAELIKQKYRYKNTCGYGINSLLDFQHPIDVIKHLMIGSEGTLGFIADITYHTVDDHQHKITGFYIFDDLNLACNLVPELANLNVTALELLDFRALNSVANKPLMQKCLNQNSDTQNTQLTENSAALLIEVHAKNIDELETVHHQCQNLIAKLQANIQAKVEFTKDQQISSELWQIRKATFPAVGAVRQKGTTVIIEDVTFPIEKLALGVKALQSLFQKYQYNEAIIFGHALDGNLHFVFTQSFNEQSQTDRYSAFMQEVSQLVAIEFKGALKAEHGTGRNMAPFVELEWGTDAYKLMQQVKLAFDPNGILNPDVLISDNKNIHLENLKTLPPADDIIDQCIECGFCESVCPSNEYTLTPRQRISVWRRIVELENKLSLDLSNTSLKQELNTLEDDYQRLGIDTCAATGLCGLKCPVGINTGEFIKSLRAKKLANNLLGLKISKFTAKNLDKTVSVAKVGLSAVNALDSVMPKSVVEKSFQILNSISKNYIPLYYPAWPKGEKSISLTKHAFTTQKQKVIYIPSCGGRTFAQDKKASDQRPLFEVITSILEKANFEVLIPPTIKNLCCGMPWQSKGDNLTAKQKSDSLIAVIKSFNQNNSIPVIMDASPCALTLNNSDKAGFIVYETAEFINKNVLTSLAIIPQSQPITLHVTCSSKRQNIEHHLMNIAKTCASEVLIPSDINCCGFAGDKGFFEPKLNENALKTLKPQINNFSKDPSCITEGFSNSKTCEIGLTKASDIPYQSIVYLLDRVSSPIQTIKA
ncbi:FAD-binding oxidoreductase [Pseudoalteromonas sp. C2R02]|uniref:FAD-binding and (Fe-S)-binding domain-containing protein n=1 Tax=Pseudoalteromonas sp. C2R02 TaxID=2841565 RepID=UPI001C090C93|nr:FAD-binding and (Fe-S)-binding domain-containing protein [Pseudoalteromonas sp. C2R02]MBU2972655.1 FAD-binding oxidoreductase [Pseudoalteromonas sp. C2R02]